MNPVVVQALGIYGLAAVVSLVIAALIKVIVLLLGRYERPAAAPAPAAVAPVAAPVAAASGVPEAHLAVIGAAVYAALGEHRIVHIETSRRGGGWAADGRHAHHGSHTVPTRPAKR